MKYYFPLHLDGGNRGCEGIAKGTALLLHDNKEHLVGFCTNKCLDQRLGIEDYVTLEQFYKRSFYEKVKMKIYNLFVHNKNKRLNFYYAQVYRPFLDRMNTDDIMLSTGGDMMCYSNNQAIFTVNYTKQRGLKSILWACSIGENNLTPEKIKALRNFSLIYARESLTKEMLNKHGFNNVVLYPDPAFVLNPECCPLPYCFSNSSVIGLNISNYILGGFNMDSPFAIEVIKFVKYILSNTKLHILLIPHVMWEGQDDRIVSQKLSDIFGKSDRISILNSEELNYCQIRYVISKCKYFIGARTHSVISAYSTFVPAIALGYSIKSIGISNDLGLPKWTVVDSKNLKIDELINSFIALQKDYKRVKSILQKARFSYMEQLNGIMDIFHKL